MVGYLFFNHELHFIDYILQKQVFVDDVRYDMPLIYNVEGRCLHFGRSKFSLITQLHFGSFSFRTFKSVDVKFVSRVLSHKSGLKVTNLHLLGVIEDEKLFGTLVDDDYVRVCLLLALEVIFMGKKLVDEVPDTLMGLVENLEIWILESLKEAIIGGTRSTNLIGIIFHEFYIAYIPRTPPIRYPDPFDDYLNKLAASRKRGKIDTRVLPIIRRCDTSSVEEIRLKGGVITELKSRVFKLEAINKVVNAVAYFWWLGNVRKKDASMKRIKRKGAYYWGDTFVNAKKYRPFNGFNDHEMTQFLKDVTPWVEDLSRYNKATEKVHLTNVFDIFLGHPGPLRCRPIDVDWALLVVTLCNFSFKMLSCCGMLMALATKLRGAMLTSIVGFYAD
uniref:Phospholipase-like protein n=1 Tax=Tanacetum cinerariifolium TaxID=118510 RepID=A0A6L2J613_TANCI|nr:phospholipase-like protein [Tanacetum cinerariifolium]